MVSYEELKDDDRQRIWPVECIILTLGGGIMMGGPESPYLGLLVVPESMGGVIGVPLQVVFVGIMIQV